MLPARFSANRILQGPQDRSAEFGQLYWTDKIGIERAGIPVMVGRTPVQVVGAFGADEICMASLTVAYRPSKGSISVWTQKTMVQNP